MKILFVLPALSGGGAERVVTQIASAFQRDYSDEIEISVVSLLENDNGAADSFPTFFLSCPRVGKALVPLYKIIQKFQPAVVVSTLKHVTLLISIIKLGSAHRFRHVARVANTYSMEIGIGSAGKMKIRLTSGLIRFANSLVDDFICVSEGVSTDLQKYFGVESSRCRVIYNPIDLQKIKELADVHMPPVLTEPRLPTILAVGRLSKQKDYAMLINAFRLLSSECDCRLVILGEGNLRGEIEDKIKKDGLTEKVYLEGFIANPYPYFKLADVFALSSLYEGLPNVLLEALAFDLPVVSTDCNYGPAEIITASYLGQLVPVGDAEKMGQALLQQLDSGRDTRRSAYVAKHFSLDAVSARYKHVFSNV
jgi:glycosyltransferase involved in cell wall biosynthesis